MQDKHDDDEVENGEKENDEVEDWNKVVEDKEDDEKEEGEKIEHGIGLSIIGHEENHAQISG